MGPDHRLNMELVLHSLFGLHVYSCAHGLRPRNTPPPLPPHWGSNTRALLVSQDRRHLFVTPWLGQSPKILTEKGKWSVCNIAKFVAIFSSEKKTKKQRLHAGSRRICKLCTGTTQFWVYFIFYNRALILITSTSLLTIIKYNFIGFFKAEFLTLCLKYKNSF